MVRVWCNHSGHLRLHLSDKQGFVTGAVAVCKASTRRTAASSHLSAENRCCSWAPAAALIRKVEVARPTQLLSQHLFTLYCEFFWVVLIVDISYAELLGGKLSVAQLVDARSQDAGAEQVLLGIRAIHSLTDMVHAALLMTSVTQLLELIRDGFSAAHLMHVGRNMLRQVLLGIRAWSAVH